MARKFLPSLRSGGYSGSFGPIESEPEEVYHSAPTPTPVETKALTLGPAFASTTAYGSNIYGTEGRADAWDMDAVITEGYERAIWVYRCVELVSGHASRLPFRAGRLLGTDFEEVLESHPLYRVLNKRANPMEKARHFRKRLVAQLLLSKRGVFVEVIKSRAGRIVRLDLLDPSRTRPIPDPHGDYILHFEYIRRDGQVREIPTDRVRWIREPHPTDPFSGTTPLEAAGLSVELDFLSRLYNSTFIKADARPGGIVAVDSDSLSDQEMDRIERKFQPGAQHAGELTVIGSGPGGINYVDTTTKPRDMQYETASRNAKVEILGAFGIGESLLGNASERSFENADAELYNFWTQVMPPILELVADAFDEDLPDDWEPFFDTSGIEVLELPRRRDREEARSEVSQGLRSIDEYRPMAGLKPLNNAQTRALWVSPAKAPIPGNPDDAAELGLTGGDGGMGGEGGMPPEGGAPTDGGAPPEGGGAPAPEQPVNGDGAAAVAALESAAAGAPVDGPPADGGVDESLYTLTPDDLAAADAVEGGGDAAAAVADAQAQDDTQPAPGDATAAVADAGQDTTEEPAPGDGTDALTKLRRLEGKSLEVKALSEDGPASVESDVDPNAVSTLALSVTAALDALMARQLGVITARLESPKTRKGTKFWTADGPADTRGGDAPIDAEKVVDSDRWETEVADTVAPLTGPAAAAAAAGLIGALAAAGLIVGGAETAEEISSVAAAVGTVPAGVATATVSKLIGGFLAEVTDTIRVASAGTSRIEDVTTAVRGLYAHRAHDLASHAASFAATATINGARDAAAQSLLPVPAPDGTPSPAPIIRIWVTVGDDRVRPEHRAAEGQMRHLDEPFIVGGLHIPYPAYPLAPPHLRYGCRCHLRYRVDGAARLIAPPAA